MTARTHQFFALGLLVVIGTLQCHAADVNGGWSPWSQYGTTCSLDCGNGTRTIYRKCNNPEPQGTGAKCVKEDGTAATDDLESKNITCMEKLCITGYEEKECDNCTVGTTYNYTMCGPEPCTYIEPQKTPCNNWNKTTCPNPCLKVKCPEYGVCKENSTDQMPGSYCSCTMGYKLDAQQKICIRPPPTKPTKRPNPTMAAEDKKVAAAISKSASSVLIAFVGLTLIVFIFLRIFTVLRVIQMNMEISLICAHVLLLFPSSIVQNQLVCKIVSIFIHFFFTACFNFMMLEALHMYSMVSYVVKSDGMLTRLQNTVIGWGLSSFVLVFTICFQYQNYGGEYHCWLQMDTPLSLGELIPILIMTIATVTLTEAAGAADYIPLKGVDGEQYTSSRISQRTNLIILPFVIAHMLVGMLSEFEQNLPLYGTFSILNGVTGGLIFFLHCSSCEKVRNKFQVCCKSVSNKARKK